MFLRTVFCFLIMIFSGGAFPQERGSRVALVIGNSAYKRSALANPVNDARLMAARLKAQGFEVFDYYDASQRDMKSAVQSFAAALRERGKDVAAFIFYAGHGVQVKGENYLIPVDEHIKSEGDVDIDAVSLSSIMSELENAETRLSVVVLDACRDNPFGYARGGLRGLARVDAPSGSLVAFSTAPGKAAPDGPAGGNSYYSAALADAISEPGLKIEEVFKKVRVVVREKTKGEQTPWESTSLTGEFYPAGERVAHEEQPTVTTAKADDTRPSEDLAQLFKTCVTSKFHPDRRRIIKDLAELFKVKSHIYSWGYTDSKLGQKIERMPITNVKIEDDALKLTYGTPGNFIKLLPIANFAPATRGLRAPAAPIDEKGYLLEGMWSQNRSYGCISMNVDETTGEASWSWPAIDSAGRQTEATASIKLGTIAKSR